MVFFVSFTRTLQYVLHTTVFYLHLYALLFLLLMRNSAYDGSPLDPLVSIGNTVVNNRKIIQLSKTIISHSELASVDLFLFFFY